MGKGKAPSPDPNIGKAALMEAQLGAEWLKVAQEQFVVSNERNAELDALSKRVTEQQLSSAEQAQTWATEDRARYKSVFQPLQDEMIAEAQKYGTQEYQDDAAAKARADVMASASAQAGQRERRMASMGVSPTSGRFAGVERAADTMVALGAASAENGARDLARNKALALKADAINLGNGLPSSAAGSLGLGVNAGSAAIGTAAVPINAYNNSLGILQGGYQTAMQGYRGQGQTLNNLYQNQLSAYQAQQQAGAGLFGALGSVAGAAMPFLLSSKDYKTDKLPAKGVLAKVRAMPVEEWSYKAGIADGGRHIGPYAEDFQAATGKGDGKTIPIVDAIGITLGAVKELDAKVDRMARGVIRPKKAA